MTHRYAEALRWIADGKDVQIRWGLNSDWLEMAPRNEIVNDEVLRGVGEYEFRLKPRTVKIGSREVEAPVLEPVKMTSVFFLDTSSMSQQCRFNWIVYNPEANPPNIEQLRSRGLLFASRAAAERFHDALSELLTGSAT